jgi:hypothetical protein
MCRRSTKILCAFFVCHTFYIPYPSLLLDLIFIIMLIEQHVNILFITYISPTFCNFRPFRSKHSRQYHVLEHPQSSSTWRTVSYVYAVASKCSQNHFISERYKTLQLFKLHFLQNSPLVQIYTYARDFKVVGNIPGTHFVKAFSALPSHSEWC